MVKSGGGCVIKNNVKNEPIFGDVTHYNRNKGQQKEKKSNCKEAFSDNTLQKMKLTLTGPVLLHSFLVLVVAQVPRHPTDIGKRSS